jgi:hypothetical protein
MLARGSAAEVAVDDQHRRARVGRIAERVRGIRGAVVLEEMLFESVKRHRHEKARRHDAVRVDVVAAQRQAAPVNRENRSSSHEICLFLIAWGPTPTR